MGPVRGRILGALACAIALTAVVAPAAVSSSTGPTTPLAALESGVVQQLNTIREQHGLTLLRVSMRLTAAATQHSREMASGGYFDHSSVDGTPFSARLAHWYPSGGYDYWSVGENLLWSSPNVGPAVALDRWMRSPEHRAIILDARWREIGVSAVHVSAAGGTYRHLPVTIITTDFGVRR
ncbi:MAG: CAP domain-containing protein [Gaiellaceae bacterium]